MNLKAIERVIEQQKKQISNLLEEKKALKKQLEQQEVNYQQELQSLEQRLKELQENYQRVPEEMKKQTQGTRPKRKLILFP